MRNRILAIALIITASSCNIFKKVNTDTEKSSLDSTAEKSVFSKKIDTSSFKNYTKITIKGFTTPSAPDFARAFVFPWDLIRATNSLAQASKNLQDSINVPFVNVPAKKANRNRSKPKPESNLPLTPNASGAIMPMDITFENWSNQQQGITDIFKSDEKADLSKNLKTDNSVSEGSSKLVLILCISGAFVLIVLIIFVFLYLKSGNSLMDLFKKKVVANK